MDTHSQPGHYDLLVPKCHLGATSPPATTLASSQSNISFEEFLKDAFVLADKSTMPPPSNDSSCIMPNASPEDPLICNKETNTTDGNDCTKTETSHSSTEEEVIRETDRNQKAAYHDQTNSPEPDIAKDEISLPACDQGYPSIWTAKQAEDFYRDHRWLLFSNGCLGCRICKQVTCYGTFKTQGIKISKPWTECSVTFNGKERKKKPNQFIKEKDPRT